MTDVLVAEVVTPCAACGGFVEDHPEGCPTRRPVRRPPPAAVLALGVAMRLLEEATRPKTRRRRR